MRQPLRATLASVTLVPWLVIVSVLPPEHRHEADSATAHAVVHRHLDLHDHDDAELTADGECVVWLDEIGVQQRSYELAAPLAAPTRVIELVAPSPRWMCAPIYDTAQPHGPPRRLAALRAPPASA